MTEEKLHDEIKQRAYALFMERGNEDGYSQHDWYKAEKEVLARHKGTSKKGGSDHNSHDRSAPEESSKTTHAIIQDHSLKNGSPGKIKNTSKKRRSRITGTRKSAKADIK